VNINNRLGLIACSLFLLALTACGGGGGGDTGGGTPATTPPSTTTNGSTPGNTSGSPDNGSSAPPPTANTSRFLYMVANSEDGRYTLIKSYSIDAATGALAGIGETGREHFPGGGLIAVDPFSKFLYAEGDGKFTGYSINGATGALTSTGTSVPAHIGSDTLHFVPSGKFAYAPNMGNEDPTGTVSGYSVNAANGALSEIPGSPFPSGERSFWIAFDPSGKFAYVANALSGIWGYRIDSTTGALTNIGSISEQGTNFVAVAPSGKFAYVVNYLANDISVYSIDPTTGLLTSIGPRVHTEESPGYLTFTPSGKFAYVTLAADDILVYSVDTTTGVMTSLGPATGPRSGRAAFTIEASGKFAYVGNMDLGNVSAYRVDAATGALTEIPGSPFATGALPHSLVAAGQ